MSDALRLAETRKLLRSTHRFMAAGASLIIEEMRVGNLGRAEEIARSLEVAGISFITQADIKALPGEENHNG